MSHQAAAPFAHTVGSKTPKIVLLGEAWGKEEEAMKQPFVGESGKELMRMLGEAMPTVAPGLHAEISKILNYGNAWVKDRTEWFEEAGILLTNVFSFRPTDNKIETLHVAKKQIEKDPSYTLPPMARGKYLDPSYRGELSRLEAELLSLRPNVVVALGATATWALCGVGNIGSTRGTAASGALGSWKGKVVPTYHPAGVLRSWSWRPIVVADLMKATRESAFSEIRRPARRILINPSLSEAVEFINGLISRGSIHNPILIAADTETEARQITCLSLAAETDCAIVIPFWDKTKPGYSYWSEQDEFYIWEHLKFLLESPRVRLLWQNGVYDFQYITPMNIKIHRSTEDTMLLHHALYPELQKGLGFLGSLYTNEASWKLMRNWKQDTEKRDE